jgi:hypothetical protein
VRVGAGRSSLALLHRNRVTPSVLLAVLFEHRLHPAFDRLRLMRKLRVCAAPGFARIAWQPHPVDRKHLPPNQTLTIADQDYLGKDRRDLIAQAPHKRRNRRVRRLRVA